MEKKWTLCGATVMAVVIYLATSVTPWAATLTLSGSVPPSHVVEFTPSGEANALELGTGGTFTLAVINEQSNSQNGYTVTLISANTSPTSGATFTMAGTGDNTDTPTYTLTYDGAAVNRAASGEATLTASNVPTPAGGVNKTLEITLPESSFYAADTYSDTLTITLTSN